MSSIPRHSRHGNTEDSSRFTTNMLRRNTSSPAISDSELLDNTHQISSTPSEPPPVDLQRRRLLVPDPLARLLKQANQSLDNKFETNISNCSFVPYGTVPNVLDNVRLHSIAEAFYDKAEQEGSIDGIQKQERIEEFVSCIEDGNLLTFATMIYGNCAYPDLWLFDRDEERMKNGNKLSQQQRVQLDNTLPLSRPQARRLLGPLPGSRFHSDQYIFIPAVLDENQHYERQDPLIRLPIISKSHMKSGSYSDVWQLWIAPGGWRDSKGDLNTRNLCLAQKVYRGEDKEDREQLRKQELDVQGKIWRSRTHHDHIVKSLGSLDEGSELSLFFPLADCSLELALHSDKRSRKSIKQELLSLAGVADALDFLRTKMSVPGEKVGIYHRDFRPDNILIFDDDYKITDFGISRVKVYDGALSPRAAVPLPEDACTYSAPPGCPDSARDVWGFVAISMVCITHKVGGPKYVFEFTRDRKRGQTYDKFWTRDKHDSIVINPNLGPWIETVVLKEMTTNRTSGVIVKEVLSYLLSQLHQFLIPDREPPSAKSIVDTFEAFAEKLPDISPETLPDTSPEILSDDPELELGTNSRGLANDSHSESPSSLSPMVPEANETPTTSRLSNEQPTDPTHTEPRAVEGGEQTVSCSINSRWFCNMSSLPRIRGKFRKRFCR